MNPEDLLLPRYKVIANFPDSPYKIGEIIYPITDYGSFQVSKDLRYTVPEAVYPAIFQKLEWWQDRKEDDLPEYIIWENTGQIRKVTRYVGVGNIAEFDDGMEGLTSFYLPATEAEYLEYKNKNQ